MGVEIERKFLVVGDHWKSLGEPISYRQGYLSLDPKKNVRVRAGAGRAFLTVKGAVKNLTRAEFEYEIPLNDGEQLLELCGAAMIEKNRYLIKHQSHIWEVDEFLGENKGLVVAEIELQDAGESFVKPDWVGKEVSDDLRYFNSRLVQLPFSRWG